jgi:DNA-binding NarL/FixJ family response regulator
VRHIRVLLLVEEQIGLRGVLRRYLAPLIPARVVEAGDAAEAIRLATQWQPEVVLVDFRLPDRSGVAVIADLRRIQPRAVIVAMASEPEPEDYLAATRAGAAIFLATESLGWQLEPAIREAFRAAESAERQAWGAPFAPRLDRLRQSFEGWRSRGAETLHWLDAHGPWPGRPRTRILYAIDLLSSLTLVVALHHPAG